MSRTVEEMQDDVRKAQLALAEGLDVSEIDKYTTDQVETLLKKLPISKYKAAQEMVSALIVMKDAKRHLSKTRAQALMRATGHRETLTNAQDRKAWADEQPEVEEAEMNLISAEARLKMAELKLEAMDDILNAVKKIASIRIEQDKDQANAHRYGGTGN
jgi:3-mercaptopyruvate sulfurtransferase SseA